MAALCFIDTETTGLHLDREVWEIAMIRRDDDGEDEISIMVDVDVSNADPFGLAIGRFYERHPFGKEAAGGVDDHTAVSRAWAAKTVASWTHGAHLIGSVPNFDAETLAPLLREYGYLPGWHYHLIDVENLAVGWLLGHAAAMGTPLDVVTAAVPPWKSDELSRAVGIEPPSDEERHTALGDARWAMRLYDAITKGS